MVHLHQMKYVVKIDLEMKWMMMMIPVGGNPFLGGLL